MMSPSSGLYERMVWFWHTHLTTHHSDVSSDVLVSRQLELLRTHALGNFRDLLQGFIVDGALLQYLNGSGSEASNPNENLARELMGALHGRPRKLQRGRRAHGGQGPRGLGR